MVCMVQYKSCTTYTLSNVSSLKLAVLPIECFQLQKSSVRRTVLSVLPKNQFLNSDVFLPIQHFKNQEKFGSSSKVYGTLTFRKILLT